MLSGKPIRFVHGSAFYILQDKAFNTSSNFIHPQQSSILSSTEDNQPNSVFISAPLKSSCILHDYFDPSETAKQKWICLIFYDHMPCRPTIG